LVLVWASLQIEHGLVLSMAQVTASRRSATERRAPRMTVPALSQGVVFGAAGWIVLDGDAGPMIDGIDEPAIVARRRTTILLLPDRLVTGADPHKQRKP
jgi:hypothetical protein